MEVVLSTLLYAAETWTVCIRHLRKLEAFQQRCLRKIMNIKWESFISDLEVLQKAQVVSVENVVLKKQLMWSGHITRMEDSRIPKQLLFGELESGQRLQWRPRKRYRDELKVTMGKFGIDDLEMAKNRPKWRKAVNNGAALAEEARTSRLHQLRLRRKHNTEAAPTGFSCNLQSAQGPVPMLRDWPRASALLNRAAKTPLLVLVENDLTSMMIRRQSAQLTTFSICTNNSIHWCKTKF